MFINYFVLVTPDTNLVIHFNDDLTAHTAVKMNDNNLLKKGKLPYPIYLCKYVRQAWWKERDTKECYIDIIQRAFLQDGTDVLEMVSADAGTVEITLPSGRKQLHMLPGKFGRGVIKAKAVNDLYEDNEQWLTDNVIGHKEWTGQ